MIKGKKAILCAVASILFANTATSTIPANAMHIEIRTSSSKMEVVNATNLNVRKSPSANAAKLGSLKCGEIIDVLSISNGWAKINFKNTTAYVSAKYLKAIVTKEMVVKVDDLNVRTGMGTKYAIIGKLSKGDKVTVISESTNGWVKVLFNNKVGYVSNAKGAYLEKVSSTPSNPSVPNQPSNPDVSVTKYKANEALNLRKTASWSGEKLAVIKKGTELEALSESNGWIKVNYNGIVGYLPTSHVTKVESSSTPSQPSQPSQPSIPEVDKKQMVVKVDDLSVRKGAGTSYTKLGSLNKGDIVTIIEELSNGWVKIEYKNGFGYVSNKKGAYLEESKELNDKNAANKVIAMIDALNSNVTLDIAIEVEDARRAFDSLNPEAQALVGNIQKLIDAEKIIAELDVIEIDKINVVAEKIDELEALGEVTTANLQDVKDKISEIDTLVADIHPLHVQNISGLRIVNTIREKVVAIEKDINDAKKVEDIIALLDNVTIEASHKVQINDARKAFDELSPSAKQLVSNEQILIDAENDLEVIVNKVNAISNRIDALPAINEIKISDETEILAIIDEVRALTPDELALIPSLTLEFLEGAYITIQDLKLADKEQGIAADLVSRIDALHTKLNSLNYSDKTEYDAVRDAYNDLTEYGKNLVTNFWTKFIEVQTKMNSVYTSIMHVEHLISLISDPVTLNDTTPIKNADDAFIALGAENQAAVKQDAKLKLENAKQELEALKTLQQAAIQNNPEIQEVINDILVLPQPEDVVLDDKDEIMAAAFRFRSLPEADKFAVDTYSLTLCFDQIETLMAEEVVDAISKLPNINDLELGHADLLVSVREQYKEISMRNNNKVTNIDVLDALEAKMLELKGENPEIVKIINMITALDKDVTFDNFDKVVSDVEAIDILIQEVLDNDNANGTNNFDKISNIEAYEEVLTQLEVLNRVSHVTTVEQVQDMINALPDPADVTWYRHDDIIDARNAFIKVPGANNEDKLIAVEQAHAVIQNRVNEVITAIHAIPNIEDITVNDEAVIRNAETIYNKYDEKVKGPADQLTKFKLHNAISRLEQLLQQS